MVKIELSPKAFRFTIIALKNEVDRFKEKIKSDDFDPETDFEDFNDLQYYKVITKVFEEAYDKQMK